MWLALLALPFACGPGGKDTTPAESSPDSAGDTAETAGHTADSARESGHTGAPAPLTATATVAANPDNPFSALVTVTPSADAQVRVRYGEGEADHVAGPFAATAEAPLEVAVLGLRASRTFTLVPEAATKDEAWTGDALTWTTDPVPAGFPSCTVVRPTDRATPDEAVCTELRGANGQPTFACFDHAGAPVHAITAEDGTAYWSTTRLADGHWASTGQDRSIVAWWDPASRLERQLSETAFAGRTRFDHQLIDPHELLELTAGPWAGAVAFATNSAEYLPDGGYLVGNGFIVYDAASDTVLYDYSFLGDLTDGVSNDPRVPFSRPGIGDYDADWTHLNALIYGQDDDGRGYFLVSLKAQDWIVKLYPDTDEIAWILGKDGDFTLVDDLDAPTPAPLSDLDWIYHAHGMSWIDAAGPRARLLVFDNGFPRHDGDEVRWDLRYSRVVEVDLDEDTRLASTPYVVGSADPKSPDWFFSETGGNARLLPGDRVLFDIDEQLSLREASWPDGAPLWQMDCEYHGVAPYRATWVPGW